MCVEGGLAVAVCFALAVFEGEGPFLFAAEKVAEVHCVFSCVSDLVPDISVWQAWVGREY